MKIYAIPGLGTTKDLYVNTQISHHELIILNWPEPTVNDTLATYSKKFLNQINTSEPFCLMGVSFGGMLCTELSKICQPQQVILISTCKTRAELPWFIRCMKYLPLHLIVSERYHRKLAYHGRWFIGFGSAYIPEFLGMIDQMQQGYFKRCIHMIATWQNEIIPENYYHIHGTNDRLLSHKNVKAHLLIEGGSHAMVVFRANEINPIIDKLLQNA